MVKMKPRTAIVWLRILAGSGLLFLGAPAIASSRACATYDFAKIRSFTQESPAIVCDIAHRRLLVIGELHGTEQTPAFVAQLVRDASKNRPVRLGIEYINGMQLPIKAFLRSKGTNLDRDALFKIGYWSNRDGRTSMAMKDMIQALRQLRAEGRDVDIFTMKPDWPGQAAIDKAGGQQRFVNSGMAEAVRSHVVNSNPDTLVIAYMGDAHSTINPLATAPEPTVTAQLVDLHPTLLVLHEPVPAEPCDSSTACKKMRILRGQPMHGAFLKYLPPLDGARVIEVAMPRYTQSPQCSRTGRRCQENNPDRAKVSYGSASDRCQTLISRRISERRHTVADRPEPDIPKRLSVDTAKRSGRRCYAIPVKS